MTPGKRGVLGDLFRAVAMAVTLALGGAAAPASEPPTGVVELSGMWRTTEADVADNAHEHTPLLNWAPMPDSVEVPRPLLGDVRWIAADVPVSPGENTQLLLWTRAEQLDVWCDGRRLLGELASGRSGRAHRFLTIPHELTRDGTVRLTLRVQDTAHTWALRQQLYGPDAPPALGDAAALQTRALDQTRRSRDVYVHQPLAVVSLLLLAGATGLVLGRRHRFAPAFSWFTMTSVLTAAWYASTPLAWIGWTPVGWLPTLEIVLADLALVAGAGFVVRLAWARPDPWVLAGQWVGLVMVLTRLFLGKRAPDFFPLALDYVVWIVLILTTVAQVIPAAREGRRSVQATLAGVALVVPLAIAQMARSAGILGPGGWSLQGLALTIGGASAVAVLALLTRELLRLERRFSQG